MFFSIHLIIWNIALISEMSSIYGLGLVLCKVYCVPGNVMLSHQYLSTIGKTSTLFMDNLMPFIADCQLEVTELKAEPAIAVRNKSYREKQKTRKGTLKSSAI